MSYLKNAISEASKIKNHAGGLSFKLEKWKILENFLIMGTEGGNYYVGQRDLTKENIDNVRQCITENIDHVLHMLVDISSTGRSMKNDTCVFVLALCVAHNSKTSLKFIPEICRTSTHLFLFLNFLKKERGWGRSIRRAISEWYTKKSDCSLIYQVLKYRNRHGWTHKDVIRLAHPKSDNPILSWIAGKEIKNEMINTFESLPTLNVEQTIKAIKTYNFTWEMLDTNLLKNPEIWKALMPLPITALIRNLGRFSSLGMTKDFADFTRDVYELLKDEERIKSSRIHPVSIMVALLTYQKGRGNKGSLLWEPSPLIRSGLMQAFEHSIKNVEATNKKIIIGVDVSGSMCGTSINGIQGVSADQLALLMAGITAKVEPDCIIQTFDTSVVQKITLHESESVFDFMDRVRFNGGGTNCAAIVERALKDKINCDAFVIYTDSEQWIGRNCDRAIDEYHSKINPCTKVICCSTTANSLSVVPKDSRFLNICGFDPSCPEIISNFLKS